VGDCYKEGEWIQDFKRSFGPEEVKQWEDLLDVLEDSAPIEGRDEFSWVHEKSGRYTTRSMYRILSHRGVSNFRMEKIWKSKLPLKLKVFMWQTYHDRFQTGVVLKKWRRKESMICIICGAPETGDHILFSCVPAKFMWASLQEALGWGRSPESLDDFFITGFPRGALAIISKSSCWV
jgi:hypothetical protein